MHSAVEKCGKNLIYLAFFLLKRIENLRFPKLFPRLRTKTGDVRKNATMLKLGYIFEYIVEKTKKNSIDKELLSIKESGNYANLQMELE